jgi:hypothetical protein
MSQKLPIDCQNIVVDMFKDYLNKNILKLEQDYKYKRDKQLNNPNKIKCISSYKFGDLVLLFNASYHDHHDALVFAQHFTKDIDSFYRLDNMEPLDFLHLITNMLLGRTINNTNPVRGLVNSYNIPYVDKFVFIPKYGSVVFNERNFNIEDYKSKIYKSNDESFYGVDTGRLTIKNDDSKKKCRFKIFNSEHDGEFRICCYNGNEHMLKIIEEKFSKNLYILRSIVEIIKKKVSSNRSLGYVTIDYNEDMKDDDDDYEYVDPDEVVDNDDDNDDD